MFNLLPTLKAQFLDDNANPLSNGKLYSYIAGSSTPIDTFTDSSGSVVNSNPIILNSRGEADVWISSSVVYKFVLTTSDDVEIYSVDNVRSQGGSGGSGGSDELVKVSVTDMQAGYLVSKLVGSNKILLSTLNQGAIEQLKIDLAELFASDISNDSNVSGINTRDALNTLLDGLNNIIFPVTSVNGDIGDVVLESSDINDSSIVGGVTIKDSLDLLQTQISNIPSAPVDSVNGKVGVVVLDSGDLADISSVGGATIDASLDILKTDIANIPSAPVDSVNGKVGVVVLDSSEIGDVSSVGGADVSASLDILKTDIANIPVVQSATESIEGIAEISTASEMRDGSLDNKIVTPLKLADVIKFAGDKNSNLTSLFGALNTGRNLIYVSNKMTAYSIQNTTISNSIAEVFGAEMVFRNNALSGLPFVINWSNCEIDFYNKMTIESGNASGETGFSGASTLRVRHLIVDGTNFNLDSSIVIEYEKLTLLNGGQIVLSGGATATQVYWDNTNTSSGSAPVTSVHGRVGDVVSAFADYVASEIGYTPYDYVTAIDVGGALSEIIDYTKVNNLNISIKQNQLTAGANITIDNTDPLNPVISSSGGGSSMNTNRLTYGADITLNQNTLIPPVSGGANWSNAMGYSTGNSSKTLKRFSLSIKKFVTWALGDIVIRVAYLSTPSTNQYGVGTGTTITEQTLNLPNTSGAEKWYLGLDSGELTINIPANSSIFVEVKSKNASSIDGAIVMLEIDP